MKRMMSCALGAAGDGGYCAVACSSTAGDGGVSGCCSRPRVPCFLSLFTSRQASEADNDDPFSNSYRS